jgi:pimeloyl-ACP methyl ester carboxylesterase
MSIRPAATADAEPTSQYLEANGIKLHLVDWGGDQNRHLILLLHGGAAHAHWWDYVAPQLTSYGRVLALDFRGHGRSDWIRPPEYGPPAYLEDVTAVIRHYGVPVVLVGHSMGGAVAQWVTSNHPELIEALIVVDAPAGPPPLWMRLMWRWRRRARGGTRPELDSAEHIVRKFRLSPPGTYLTKTQLAELALKGAEQLPNGKWAYRFDPETRAWRRITRGLQRPRLSRIKVPTLILRGAESVLVSASRASGMHRKIRGSKFVEIPAAHHHVPLDNPDGTTAAIGNFLEELEARSARPQAR